MLDGPQHRTPQRVVAERGFVDQVLCDHRRLIVGPRDLLDHHAALPVQLPRVDSGPSNEVGQQVGGRHRLFGAGGDVKRDQIVARVGVEHGADPLRCLVDVPIRAVLLPALEH